MMSRRRLALLAVAAVLVALFGGRWLALRYADAVWFAELGQGARYRALLLRSIGWQAATFLVALAWFAAHTLGVYASIGAVHLPRRLGNLEIDEAVPSRILRAIAIGTATLLALATAYTFSDIDQYIALARAAEPFGRVEPVLQKDLSFYLAVLPMLEVLHLLASVLAILSALLAIGLYAVTGSLAVSRRRVRITPHARTHLVIVLAALALVVAWGFQLDAWQMVGGGGHDGGALSPADRSIRIPASSALAILALVVAAGSVMALRWVRPALLFGLWATLGVSTIIGRLVVPVMTEAWGAASEPSLVSQVRRHTTDYSRLGFGILDAPERLQPAGETRPDSTAGVIRAIEGIYAWSAQPELVGQMLDDQGHDTSGLRIWSVTPTEARDASGTLRPAAIAVPQTDVVQVMRRIPRLRWDQLHRGPLAWGGEPVALEAVPRAGTPAFLASLAPADSAPPGAPLRGAPTRVRFVPYAADLAIVGPDEGTPGEPAPGILLGGMLRRLMLGWALQSPPLLDEHTSRADRVLYWRDIPSRLARLYPFAGFDPARAAIVENRLIWIVDGYLISSRFPLAEPVRWGPGEAINYLSSPYVVTVDAVSGDTRFYLRPPASTFAASIARSGRVDALPPESLPAGVRAALRYPEGLLSGQAAMMARRGDVDDRGQPAWTLAWRDTSQANRDAALIRPTVALATLDSASPRPWQFVPIVDARAHRLAAIAAGSTTPAGELEVFQLRISGSAPTPQSAAVRMAGSPPPLQAGPQGPTESAPHRGPVQVVPSANGVIYAQILFTIGRVHEPVRVNGIAILAGSRAGVGADARSAVRSMVRGEGDLTGAAIAGAELGEARAAFLALDSARESGDWERFGRAWQALRHALRLEPLPPPTARPPSGPRARP